MRSKESVGCLVIGEGGERMGALRERLGASGVATACCATPCAGDLLESAQMALYEVRSPLGACVAAEGAYWAVALALAVQLNVERVALIFPDDICPEPMRRPLDRLAGFARRNLFFCVSDVLVLEGEGGGQAFDRVCRRMCNARVRRVSILDQKWTNCKQSPIEAVARFLEAGVFPFALAKSREKCIIEA